jgi:hypothetical protein
MVLLVTFWRGLERIRKNIREFVILIDFHSSCHGLSQLLMVGFIVV